MRFAFSLICLHFTLRNFPIRSNFRIQDLSLRKSMHITCIMLRIINVVAVVLMRFFESNLKIEHFTEKN